MLLRIHLSFCFFNFVLENFVMPFKQKVSFERFALEHIRKPITVVRPHPLKRYFISLKPLWLHFF